MNKIIQITTVMILFVSFYAQADVNFTLTNKSAEPIIITGYANENPFTFNYQTLENTKTLNPNETFSLDIDNGKLDLVTQKVNGNKRRYETAPSANNKNKILIWENSQLYPASDKHRMLGIIKTKTTIQNNVSIGEISQTEQ